MHHSSSSHDNGERRRSHKSRHDDGQDDKYRRRDRERDSDEDNGRGSKSSDRYQGTSSKRERSRSRERDYHRNQRQDDRRFSSSNTESRSSSNDKNVGSYRSSKYDESDYRYTSRNEGREDRLDKNHRERKTYDELNDQSQSGGGGSYGISIKLATPAAPAPVPSLPKPKPIIAPSVQKPLKVASIFNDDDDDEPEEMPPECKMRMKNVGRDTPTSAGPNSFGKTKLGFCNTAHLTEKKLEGTLPAGSVKRKH